MKLVCLFLYIIFQDMWSLEFLVSVIIILMGCIYFEMVLNDFCLQISSDAKYFPSLVQGIVIKDS